MEANNTTFKAHQDKNTSLHKAYIKHMNSILNTQDEEKEIRWETYNIIIQELITDGNSSWSNEIKYRITDGENPNKVILDVLGRETYYLNELVWILKKRVEQFWEEDYLKRFLE